IFSLSHHHTIILMLPACFYLFFLRKSSLLSLSKLKILLLFSIGFIPYIYLPISASLKPPINWENPINLKNFIKLVTRANYGTFKVGSFVGDTMLQRFLSAAVAVRTIFRDIRFFGLIMFAAGIIYSLRKFKQISIFFLILFLTNILFIAYASFPLYNNFLVGTFERFLLFPIILIMYFIGFGIDFTTVYVAKFIREKVLHNKIKPLKMTAIISLTFLIIPFSYYYINYPQVKSFKSDLTQENMAEDILNSVDNKSILFSSIDTTLFSSFYVYYWKNRWENVALVHLQKLNDPFYRDFLKEKYSWLKFPEKEFSADAFIELNYKEVPVYFIELIPDLKGDLVPNGLVYRYYLDTKDIPDDNAIISINEKLWASYKDPKQGNLIRFNNLLNADLLRIYASGHEAYGIYLLTASKYDKAEKEFIKAVYYNTNPNYFDSKVNLGIAYFKEKKCNEAIKEFNEVYEKNKENINAVGMLIKSYKECEIDPVKASEYQKIFETLVNKQKTELEKL
ncbi:MAG: hypothetical protein M1308_00355, partial [Actinobacteria bacterium]|nr:hypothetical protein [Actinomycetota bacterium]